MVLERCVVQDALKWRTKSGSSGSIAISETLPSLYVTLHPRWDCPGARARRLSNSRAESVPAKSTANDTLIKRRRFMTHSVFWRSKRCYASPNPSKSSCHTVGNAKKLSGLAASDDTNPSVKDAIRGDRWPRCPAFASKKKRKSTNEASAATKRKLTLVVELLTQRRVRFSSYQKMFDKGLRTFQRDLQQIEKIGEKSGFKLGGVKDWRSCRAHRYRWQNEKLNSDSKRLERILVTIAQALGEPIIRELGSRASDAAERDDFFSFAGPRLIEGTTVADICATLREACSSPMGRAAVRFRFTSASKGP